MFLYYAIITFNLRLEIWKGKNFCFVVILFGWVFFGGGREGKVRKSEILFRVNFLHTHIHTLKFLHFSLTTGNISKVSVIKIFVLAQVGANEDKRREEQMF